jgi:hypothetical protein
MAAFWGMRAPIPKKCGDLPAGFPKNKNKIGQQAIPFVQEDFLNKRQTLFANQEDGGGEIPPPPSIMLQTKATR